jgi:hypothetical protein
MAILSPEDPLFASIDAKFSVIAIERHRQRAVKPGNPVFLLAKILQ